MFINKRKNGINREILNALLCCEVKYVFYNSKYLQFAFHFYTFTLKLNQYTTRFYYLLIYTSTH